MSGPLTNYELGIIRHREYEAEMNSDGSENRARIDKTSLLETRLAGYLQKLSRNPQRAIERKSSQDPLQLK